MLHEMVVDVNLGGLAVGPLGLLWTARIAPLRRGSATMATPLGAAGLRLALSSPLRDRALATAELLPALIERLLSLHALGPEKVGLGEIVAATNIGKARLRNTELRLRHTGRGAARTTAAKRHGSLLKLHKIYVLLICDEIQAI